MGLIYSNTNPDNFPCGPVEFKDPVMVYLSNDADSRSPHTSIFLVRVTHGTEYDRTSKIDVIQCRRFDVVKYYASEDCPHGIPDLNNPPFDDHAKLICAARHGDSDFPYGEVRPATIEFIANAIKITSRWRPRMFKKLVCLYNETDHEALITALKILRLHCFVGQKSNIILLREMFRDVEELWDELSLTESILTAFRLNFMDQLMVLLGMIEERDEPPESMFDPPYDLSLLYMTPRSHFKMMDRYLHRIDQKFGISVNYVEKHEISGHRTIVNLYRDVKRIHVRDSFSDFFVSPRKYGLLPPISKEILSFV